MTERTALIEDVRMLVDADRVVAASRKKWGGTGFEPNSMRVWRGACSPGTLAVDVGAYTGIYSVAAAQEGAGVVAVEPNDAARERMTENVIRNGTVGATWIVRAAAGEREGSAAVEARSPLTSAATVEYGAGDVPVVTLDALLVPETARVSAIKIDTERTEMAVLRGARRTIEEHLPLLIVEVLDPETEPAVTRLVEPLGYDRIYKADERNLICEAR